MASLKEKIFRTLPLASAWNAATGGAAREPKLAEIARFVTPIRDITDQRLNLTPPDIDVFATKVKALKLPPPPPPLPAPSRDFIELWGYTASDSYTTAENISCLVDEVDNNEFARMLVLSSVEFGDSRTRTSGDFDSYVTIHFNKKRIQLDLGKESYLTSYVTHDTWTSGAGDTLWKNKLRFDPSFVHVFLFDLVRADDGSYEAQPVTKMDPTALDPYYKADEALEAAAKAGLDAPDVDARDALFNDDLWIPHPKSQSPSGSVPSTVVIGTVIARIVVTCSITVSRWDEQAAAGRATGEADIFPHIMIASTTELDRASGGVRLTRPSGWNMMDMRMKSMNTLGPHDIPKTMMDYMSAAAPDGTPYHMTKEIDAVLITDSNRWVMTVQDFFGPFVIWANLFNYYIDDPVTKLGGSVIKVVDHTRTKELSTDDGFGYVERDTSDVVPGLMGILTIGSSVLNQTFPGNRVSKYERQGAFDSIHMAPKMKIPEGLIKTLIPANTRDGTHATLTPADYAQLKMDKISMAPFCPHDCFHMHWRWTDNGNSGPNGTQIATRGWGPKEPNEVAGAPLVPHNQDVYLGLPSPHTILYLADIHGVPPDDWQVICHHGAFYALTTSNFVSAAQLEVETRLRGAFFGVLSIDRPIPLSYWSLFYWRLRYKVIVQNGHLIAQERMRFIQGWKAAADL